VEFRTAAPTLSELRLQLFTTGIAGPRHADRRQGAQSEPLIGVVHVELRPRLHHGQIAQGARKILIPQLALNSGGDEHVAGMGNL
jgi:hypothetical protein